MQLQNKTIIVTGSATGIGRAIARYCVAEGARVLIHDRDEDGARAVADELAPHAACHIDDLLDPEAPARIVAAAVDAFGGLDALVNNAAAIIRSNIHSTSTDLFDRSIAVNVRAPLLLIQAALPHLEAAEGCVLNIGSINAYCGEESLLAYSISKGGLMTLTRNLGDALHFHHGVRVNQINPGWVLTENEYRYKMEEGLPADWPERLPKDVNPSGRLTRPETIAAAAVYWLSDASRPISGAVVELEQFPVIGRNPPKKTR
jgi:NAD(P)-dependent dehydrogenase (short-subunit alcohol dehydrogenase family)